MCPSTLNDVTMVQKFMFFLYVGYGPAALTPSSVKFVTGCRLYAISMATCFSVTLPRHPYAFVTMTFGRQAVTIANLACRRVVWLGISKCNSRWKEMDTPTCLGKQT